MGGLSFTTWDNADTKPTGGKGPSKPFVGTRTELGKPVSSLREEETTPRGLATAVRVKDAGVSKRGAVIAPIRVELLATSPGPKGS